MLELQKTNHTDTYARLSEQSLTSGPEYLAAAREALASLLADPALLHGVRLDRVPGAYTRNVLYGDARITVCAMVWAAGAQTSIHDHHCSCCYAILSGALQEAWYDVVDETRARQTRQFVRSAGQIACMLPTGPNLHRMVNASGEEAISIHIYGYDCGELASSIGSEYDALDAPDLARMPVFQD